MDSSVPLSDLTVSLDENKFGQVITNLIGNALKFTPRGGQITLSVTHLEAEGRVRISVTDTGVGIAPVSICIAPKVSLNYQCAGEPREAVPWRDPILPWCFAAGRGSWLGTLQ